jgi:hypothetical protein
MKKTLERLMDTNPELEIGIPALTPGLGGRLLKKTPPTGWGTSEQRETSIRTSEESSFPGVTTNPPLLPSRRESYVAQLVDD